MASTLSHNQSVKLTKSRIDRLPAPPNGQAFYRDSQLKGFALRITAGGAKSFVVEKRIDGKVRRITLAKYGELTCEQARRQAQKLLGQVAMGMNPIAEKARERLYGLTMVQVFADFSKTRAFLKPRTLYDYQRLLQTAFADWKTRPMRSISKDMVGRKHTELGKTNGEAYANLAMRFLRSLFNFALANYEDGNGQPILAENPVIRLTRTRSWYRTKRRQGVIKVHQLPKWYQAVNELRGDPAPAAATVSDYLLLLLYSGLRRQEAAQLKWNHVDLQDRTLLIPDPKNRIPLELPLSPPLVEILTRRQEEARNAFVFPGNGPAGYLIEPKRQIAKVIEASGVHFTLHDLRRTFVTMAESLGVPPYAIKRLVNHKTGNDVTAGYIISDVERLRGPMNQVADGLVRASGTVKRPRLVARNDVIETRALIQG